MKRIFAIGTALLIGLLFAGCRLDPTGDFRFYDNAAAYAVGDFVCDGALVKRIEIDWLGGSIEMERSTSKILTVSEEENDLSEEKRLHTYLNEGVLRVKYCRSGYHGKIDEMQKNLQVDIPKGVDVKINGVSAHVYLGYVDTGTLSIRTDTGCIEGENIVCERADISTKSGYIGIGALTAKESEIESLSGDIHLSFPICQKAEIETASGDVTLYLQGSVCALIDFDTQSGSLVTQRRYVRRNERYYFAVDEGQGTIAELSVETKSGNLRVE